VCILTGHLLKDPEGAIKVSEPPVDVKKIMELKKFL
jgi:threonine synthase